MKEHKLAAIVFTDIVGYTSRMEKDEQHTMELLGKQREIIFPLVKEFGGEVIKEIGDGLLMMFTSAVKAVRFAIAVQNRLADEELTIRAGIHIGDVIFEEGDIYGSAVNIAARIEPLATAGGICISEDVNSQIRNKEDIVTISCGNKSLKGVNEQLEIFRIAMKDEIPETARPVSFFKDLWSRRVFQITAIYLVLAWLIRMATSTISTQYFLSPYLVDLVWFILISLLPSVILVSYFHGKKGVTKWTKVELIGLPVNIVLAILIMVFVFKGKDLGAATTSLTVEDEDGQLIERVVVKSEFRKKVAIFNFTNQTGDASFNYLQYSIPFMTAYDLSQDIFITANPATGFFNRLIDAGYPDGINLPLSLMKSLSENLHLNYFLTGEFSSENDEFNVNCKLYETRYAKQVSEITLKNTDVFQIVDNLSIWIKESIEIPATHITETEDLPVVEILTGSIQALENFVYANKESISNNWNKAISYLEKAIDEDPEFALAYATITMYYFNISQIENARKAISSAMTYLFKLPERQQFTVKFLYYLFRQEPEKALAVVKMWVDLYPDDLQGRKSLAERYYYKNMKAESIEEYKAVLQIDPEQYDVLNTIADVYLQMGIYDSSQHYYELYASRFPQQYESFLNLGAFYRTTNDVSLAKDHYEKALLLAPFSDKTPILIDLADIELIAGELDIALEQYQEALNMCADSRDSSNVYASLQNYYKVKGQHDKALEYHKLKINELEKYLSPKDLMVYEIFQIEAYIDAKEIDEAFCILEDFSKKLEPPLDKVVPIGHMFIYAAQGDAEMAERAMLSVEELAKSFGEEMLLANIYFSKGMIAETTGDYETAIEEYTRFLDLHPTSFATHREIAECYRKLARYEEAEKHILISLQRRPFNPENNYEAALLYLDMDDEEEALEYLKRANEVWKDADADYNLAREAREKQVEIIK